MLIVRDLFRRTILAQVYRRQRIIGAATGPIDIAGCDVCTARIACMNRR